MAEEADRFDKLPEELLTKVTGFLPLEESARTSALLSRRWRYAWRGIPNPHFDGTAATKFRSDGRPVSYFRTLDDFFNWMDRMITRKDRTGFYIGSLGLNFNPDDEDDKYGWMELRNSDSVVIGYRVVSLLPSCLSAAAAAGNGTVGFRSLSDVLSGRPYLLKHLTLRNCDEEILKSRVVSDGGGGDDDDDGGSFRGLRSLVLQCGGKSVNWGFVESVIRSFPSVMTITLENCCSLSLPAAGESIVVLVDKSRIRLSLSRRRVIRVSCE